MRENLHRYQVRILVDGHWVNAGRYDLWSSAIRRAKKLAVKSLITIVDWHEWVFYFQSRTLAETSLVKAEGDLLKLIEGIPVMHQADFRRGK